MNGKKTGGLYNTHDVVKKFIHELPVGTEFTSRDIAKKHNKTTMAVGCYMREYIGSEIEFKCRRGGGAVYVRI